MISYSKGPAPELGKTTYQYGNPTADDPIAGGPSNQVRVLRHWTGPAPADTVDYSVQYRYDPYGCRSHRWVNPTGDAVPTMPGSGVDTFAWDRECRLLTSAIAAPAPPGVDRTPGAYTFRYDHRTRRLWRASPSATALITYSGGLSVQEYTPGPPPSSSGSSESNTPTAEYIRGSDYGGGIGGILYTIRAGQASCQHYNGRGDVVAKSAADTTATVAWTAAYLAFGTRPEEHGTNPDPQRANTKEEDGTGLLNEGHRYRCLETGMFISRDPAGFVDGPNLYTYVRQNPWTSFDPEGLADHQWHHRFPKQWGQQRYDQLNIGIDIHSPKEGVLLPTKVHSELHGGPRFNSEWDTFLNQEAARQRLNPGLAGTATDRARGFANTLETSETYAKHYKQAVPIKANCSYLVYEQMSSRDRGKIISASHKAFKGMKLAAAAASVAGKTVKGAAAAAGKALPVVGGAIGAHSNITSKGWLVGGLETVVDSLPVIGTVKAALELVRGKPFIPTLAERAEQEMQSAEKAAAREWELNPFRYMNKGVIPWGFNAPLWQAQEDNLARYAQ